MSEQDFNDALREDPELLKRAIENPRRWTPPPKEEEQPESNGEQATEHDFDFPVTLEAWLARDDIIPRDLLLGDLLSTTTRGLLIGPTGLGKTMFVIAVALAIASNTDFLHWRAGRAGRVLIIDGEMPRSEMKRRLQEAVRRHGSTIPPGSICILPREDCENMPPLNTPAGQQWLDAFMVKHGKFDFIFFDNMQALLEGNMKEEEQWTAMLPYALALTKRKIGNSGFITLASTKPEATD
jgi:RecA-family ATPase